MEYAADGDLKSYIKSKFKSIGWKEKLELMNNISESLKIIHKAELVHGDLHSGNILRNKSTFYISDLGLCRPYKEVNNRTKLFGVLPYVAPEVLCGKPYGPEADVYGFGIVLWEIISGKNPYGPMPHNFDLAQSIMNGTRPPIGRNVPDELSELIQKCWSQDLKSRPSAKDLHLIFEKWLLDDRKYESWNEMEVEELPDDYYESIVVESRDFDAGSEFGSTITTPYRSYQMNLVLPDNFEE